VTDIRTRPHVLYRFFDSADRLLYVGITVRLRERLASHETEKDWYGDIGTIRVEHFASRDAVLAAEKAAIQKEKPLHNIHHNGHRQAASKAQASLLSDGDIPSDWARFTFHSIKSGYERTVPLWLYWEVNCDPISDDYYIDEIDPEELWMNWIQQYPRDEAAEQVFGLGAVSIHWFIEGPGVCEGAPFEDIRARLIAMRRGRFAWSEQEAIEYYKENQFLGGYSTPYNADTGEPIKWTQLPVIDKVWRTDRLPKAPHASKGGFIQEATGWKPSPLQPFVNIELLARASGLFRPSLIRR
jgi:predicted GIY-YIG superfamily endonuclease